MEKIGNRLIERVTNICADCVYPIKDCPWLHEKKEVEGWTAKKTQWGNKPGVYTYQITSCPLYIEPPKHPVFSKYEDIDIEQIQIMKGHWMQNGE